MTDVHLPVYSPTAVLIGSGILAVIVLGVVIRVLIGRGKPRRRRRPRR